MEKVICPVCAEEGYTITQFIGVVAAPNLVWCSCCNAMAVCVEDFVDCYILDFVPEVDCDECFKDKFVCEGACPLQIPNEPKKPEISLMIAILRELRQLNREFRQLNGKG